MKNKFKLILLMCLALGVVLALAACSPEDSPYEGLDKEGYTLSVEFDANGGHFTVNTSTIRDTYNLSEYTPDQNGNIILKLFAPNAVERKPQQRFTATKAGYSLAGWYSTRTELRDAEGNVLKDAAGNILYTYSDPWDFSTDTIAVPANEEHSAKRVFKTLYAAWIPELSYKIYNLDVIDEQTNTYKLIGEITKDYFLGKDETSITLPGYDEASGNLMYHFDLPSLDGYSYDKLYIHSDRTGEITSSYIEHPASYDPETATLLNNEVTIYCTTQKGAKYKITKPEQLLSGASTEGVYTLAADLDFEGKDWPKLFSGNEFKGSIDGNGYTIKNVTIEQSSDATAFGLFGKIAASATLKNISFTDINVVIKAFSRYQNASYGILAGAVEDGAKISGITLANSKMTVHKNLQLTTAYKLNPKFGLVTADGSMNGISYSTANLTLEFVEEITTPAFKETLDEATGRFTISIVQ